MANGRFEKNPQRRAGHYKRKLALLLSLILLVSVAVSGTLAYLLMNTESVTDTFTPAKVECVVTGSGSPYKIYNTGNIPAYIRVVVVANQVNTDGPVEFGSNNVAVETDGTGWSVEEGIYYYEEPVKPVQNPQSPEDEPDKGIELNLTGNTKGLNIQILAEAIQSIPEDEKTHPWGSSQNP